MEKGINANVNISRSRGFWDVLNLQVYSNTYMQETVTLFLLAGFGFLVPFLLGHVQLFVGPVVNAMLVASALFLRGRKILPLVLLPSLGALAGGLLFGPLTIYLIYMIPFIWAGNLIMVYGLKLAHLQMRQNYWFSAAVASAAKAVFLFASAFALYMLGAVPTVFLVAMGIMQFATAIAGSVIAYPLKHVRKFFV
ncbi:hypothetical protein KJ891_01475 [Candidatus Micrarchaeota archaeon]|nr:hypothetical protein [Candidatus Micrarchaeota archaeon]